MVAGKRSYTAIGVGFTGGTLAAGIGCCAAVGAIFVRDVTVGIGLTGSTPVTGVVSGTAVSTAHRRDGTFGTNGTGIVVTAAGRPSNFVFSGTVG